MKGASATDRKKATTAQSDKGRAPCSIFYSWPAPADLAAKKVSFLRQREARRIPKLQIPRSGCNFNADLGDEGSEFKAGDLISIVPCEGSPTH